MATILIINPCLGNEIHDTHPSTSLMPPNDDCSSALILEINPTTGCGSYFYNGSTLNATASGIPDENCNIDGWNDDVWYKFTSTTDITTIRMEPDGNQSTLDAVLYFYSGNDCNELGIQGCNLTNTEGEVNFSFGWAPGLTFYFRIATEGNNPSDVYSFNLCVSEYCFDTLDFSGNNPGGLFADDWETIGLLQTSEIINSGAVVDYDSESTVLMKNGFEVELGASFHALIDGCNNGAGGTNQLIENNGFNSN